MTNGALLLPPWAFHLPDIVAVLKARRARGEWLLNAGAAIDRLREKLATLELLKLYEQFFPAAYRKSKASTALIHPTGYSPKEIEFFQLVNRRLFPLADFWDVWEPEEIERGYSIPLETAALEADGMSEWPPFWKIMFTLAHPEAGAEWMGELDWNALGAAQLPPGAELPLCVTQGGAVRVNYTAFFTEAAVWMPRLRDLKLAFEYATQGTGNAFLDTDHEMLGCSEMPEWSAGNIEWLAKEWQSALALLKRIHAVRKWLEAKPARLARLIALWNQHAWRVRQPTLHNKQDNEVIHAAEETEDDNSNGE